MRRSIDPRTDRIAKKYKQYSLWIIAALMLLALFVMQIMRNTSFVTALAVTVIYSLVCNWVYGDCWKKIAQSSPVNLMRFYLAGSVLRLLLALTVFLIYLVVVRERQAVIGFAVIFAAYYVVLLAFDCIYFVRVEKKNNKTESE
ncbi:MAG: hypothetical protein LKH27_03515 [Prevotella sp.]|jgi:xanthine/uracil permease|nr:MULTISPECIES: hypothetical protein [unclassified Prevotella]MCH3991926.1 hypothetical protein [Prevotella sp.]MCH4017506.1 hypothetical protein [Prevotella sp.]MCH4185259.1 hypothetical protein [Prevotella sp.]MCH4215257.1 hypothetical protein [Prevotella sp.]MCH4250501.1 hypothetical protein [Prevotella sp.]